jgi:HEXXH motif-containing protein
MTTHAVPADVLDQLAVGDGGILGPLRAGQRSKRLLLLHELVSAARSGAPQTFAHGKGDESLAVLTEARRRSRHAVDEVLLQPQVGAWATVCLRGLSSDGEISSADLGHLGAVAASAALRAGLGFEVTTYVRDGSVMFPTFGTALVAKTQGWCRVRSRPGADGVEISDADTSQAVAFDVSGAGETWLPLRRLHSTAGGLTVDAYLDDLDPFRGCGHLPTAGRLDANAVEDWQAKLDEGWPMLVEEHRERAEAIGGGVVSIVPLRASDMAAELSASCHEAIGAVAMTPPPRSLSLSLALVHEFQHNKLSALLDLVALLDRPSGAELYAPWRADPRPLRGLLHGTYAFLGLTAFWEAHRRRRADSGDATAADWAHFEFALGCLQVSEAVETLRGSKNLTDPGSRFVDGMRRRVSHLARLPVPSQPRAVARLACLDHATSWRLRNLRPDLDHISSWADAWLANHACPWKGRPRTATFDGGGPIGSAARHALFRQRLAHPETWKAYAGDATPADVVLVSGEGARAADGYAAQLAHAPDDVASWAGLVLASRERPSAATAALTWLPESVYSLHRAIRDRCGGAPGAMELAHWVGCGARERR